MRQIIPAEHVSYRYAVLRPKKIQKNEIYTSGRISLLKYARSDGRRGREAEDCDYLMRAVGGPGNARGLRQAERTRLLSDLGCVKAAARATVSQVLCGGDEAVWPIFRYWRSLPRF